MTNTTATAALTALVDEALAHYTERNASRGATNVRLVAAVELDGTYAVVVEADYPGQSRYTNRTQYDGTRYPAGSGSLTGQLRTYRGPGAADPKAVARKLERDLATGADDDRILPQLTALIHNAQADELTAAAGLELGDVAYVWAMGRNRRGIVTKLTAAKVTVAYTTASSGGRVFRKAVNRDDVYVAR